MTKDLEDLFLQCMGKPERLRQYIQADTDLYTYINKTYPNFVAFAKILARIRPDLKQEASKVTHDDMLDLLRRRRPDLYTIVISEGMSWFKKQKWDHLF